MIKLAYILLSFCFAVSSFANATYPYYKTSGPVDPMPFFKADYTQASKIVCNSRQTIAMLFPGYAIIKQEFVLVNPTDSTINFFLGLPEYQFSKTEKFPSLEFNSDTLFEVYVNGTKTSTKACPYPEASSNLSSTWRTWEMNFPKQDSCTLQIFSLVKTGGKFMTYNWENYNTTFSQKISNSFLWNGAIANSSVFVLLGQGITSQDVLAVQPQEFITDGKTQFLWKASQIEPFDELDVLFRMKELFDEEGFDAASKNRNSAFEKVKNVKIPVSDTSWKKVTAANFGNYKNESESSAGGYMFFGFIAFMLLAIPAAIVIFIIKAKIKSKTT